MNDKCKYISEQLDLMFPDAHCELIYRNAFELLCAVALSAQTTDIAVNRVTPKLFATFPDVYSMARADIIDIQALIKSIGLYRNKANNLKNMAIDIVEKFNGIVPDNHQDLTSLSGVGNKTASVVLAEFYHFPTFAVDTHVSRIARRLSLAKEKDGPDLISLKLRRKFDRHLWIKLHHQMIFFGRYKCHARKPECCGCPFYSMCKELNKSY